jgi:hypothetical protein
VPTTRLAAVVLCEAAFAASHAELVPDVDGEERRRVLGARHGRLRRRHAPDYSSTATAGDLPTAWLALPWLRLRGNPWALDRDTAARLLTTIDSRRLAP